MGWRFALALILALAVAPPRVAAADGQETVNESISTLADSGQKYALYLPAGYPGTRRWPVLIVLDPRGRAESTLRMAQPGAAANGWIVLSSEQSRSDGFEQVTLNALQALLREAGARYVYDPRRVYIAGMSGTAKTLWVVEKALHGQVAGYIGAGGGRPPELGRFQHKPPPYFGFAGKHDFNFQEMHELDAELARAGSPHRLLVFEGTHGWPRAAAQFTTAIDWLELMAMRDGRAPVREQFVEAQLAEARSQLAGAASPLERWRGLDQLLRDFGGLRELLPEQDEATQLAASEELQRARALEKRLQDEERRFAQQLDAWATQLNRPAGESGRLPPPDLGRTLAQLRIRSLRERANDPDPLLADSAARRLERAWTAGAHYLADARRRQHDDEGGRTALRLAIAAFPERDYARCKLAELQLRQGDQPDEADQRACRSETSPTE